MRYGGNLRGLRHYKTVVIIFVLLTKFVQGPDCTMPFSTTIGSVCFWLTSSRNDRLTAQGLCAQNNGYLALITSQTESSNLRSFIEYNGNYELNYIGYDVNHNGDLTTLDGTAQSYAPFPPSSSYDFPCVALHQAKFHPVQCSQVLYAICSFRSNTNQNLAYTSSVDTTYTSTGQSSLTTVGVVHSTSNQIALPSDSCSCKFDPNANLHPVNMTEELSNRLHLISSTLRLNKKELTSSKTKKYSAPDHRPSAVGVGSLGALLMIVIFGGIALMDITAAFPDFYMNFIRWRWS